MKSYLVSFYLLYGCVIIVGGDLYSLYGSYTGESYVVPEECALLLDDFANHAANFTQCSIKNARPIRVCEQCVDQYMNFRNKYKELLKTVVNGTSCRSIFISHDRMDVVPEFYNSVSAVWDKGYCGECFDWTQGKPVVSNNTVTFNSKYNETILCIQNQNKNSNSTEICEKCMTKYIDLDEFYKSLSVDSIGVDSVCMDIVDLMNATRYIWSKNLNCCNLRRSPQIIFLCCATVIGILPLLYYVAVKYCGPIRDLPNVLKQSRFKQMILRSTNQGIN